MVRGNDVLFVVYIVLGYLDLGVGGQHDIYSADGGTPNESVTLFHI